MYVFIERDPFSVCEEEMMQEFEFTGRTARVAKRRALNYWYTNRSRLGLSMVDFFKCCRLREGSGETQIIFKPQQAA